MKLKVFISQPMRDKTDEQIEQERNCIIEKVKKAYDKLDVEVIDSFFKDHEEHPTLWCLGESIKKLGEADIAVFALGWEAYRGCRIEHRCAKDYNIFILEEGKDI